MNEFTPLRTTMVPVTKPRTAPTKTAAVKPTATEVTLTSWTPMIAERASEALAVRSKTPLRMQIVAPAESRPMSAHWSSRLIRLPVVRNVLVLSDSAITMLTEGGDDAVVAEPDPAPRLRRMPPPVQRWWPAAASTVMPASPCVSERGGDHDLAGRASREVAHGPPVPQHDHPVRQCEQFLDRGRDADDRHAVGCEIGDEAVDLTLGADIDTPGRFIDEQDPW